MSSSQPVDNDSSGKKDTSPFHDSRDLHGIVECFERQLRSGDAPTIDELIEQYPDHATDLRRLLPMVHALTELSLDEGGIPEGSASNSGSRDDRTTPKELGDFRLVREIGRGGMGIVYEAEQLSLRRRVAVKVLPYAALLDRRQLDRFRNEARAAAMLKHPHIVHVLSVGFERGVHFYAMELVDGCSLAEVTRGVFQTRFGGESHERHDSTFGGASTTPIAALSTQHSENRPAFYRSVASLGVQATRALRVAHETGVVHRDIKPSNLLLDRDGMLQVTDFGLARIQEDQGVTVTGDLIGTLRYMSPEQVNASRTIDHRCDIYSLGATLFELAAGTPAYAAESRAELLSDILSGNSASLRRVASDIPRDLETIINKAMSHSPDARYQTAREFEADLNRYLQGKPVLARRISSLEVAWRWCLRNRAKAALFGLLTALLFAFAVGGPVVAIREAKRAREQAAIADRQRHEAYDAAMGRAHDHIEHGEIDQAVALLKEYLPGRDGAPEDYRSFEWFELAQRCQRRLEALEIGTTFPVAALAVSLNGDISAAPFDNGPVVFDAQTGARKWPLEQRAIGLRGLAFSADGRHLISVGVDGQLKVWDATSGSMLFAMELASEADSVTAIADGTIAVGLSPTNTDTFPRSNVVSIEKYQILDGETGIDVKRLGSIIGPRGGARSLASSPDGQLIAAGSEDGSLRVWNISTGDLLHEFAEFGGPVRSVAFSPSGSLVCGGGGIYKGEWLSGEAIVYDVTTRHKVVDIHPKEIVEAVIFPTDDQFATAGSDHNISLWRTDSGEPVERINAHADKIGCLAFESTSRSLISGSEDNFVRVWKLNERMPLSRVSKTSTNTHIHDLAFSPNNQLLASVSDDRSVRLWNPKEGSLVKTLGTTAHDGFGIDFSPDGKQLVTISSEWPVNRSLPSELAFWNVDSGVVNRFPLPKSFGGRSVAFAPSGKHVAVADNDGRESGRLFLWNIAEARVEKEIGSRRGFHVEFSQDGQLITTPGGLWTYPTLNNVFTLPSSEFACDISPDNMLFVASDKKSNDVVLYSANSGEEIKRLRGHKDIVIHASFSHDGRRIVTAGQRGIIVIWNVETGNEIVRYRDHQYWVWCAQFSHDDRVLASALGGRSFLPGIVIRRALDEQTARTLLEGRQ